MKPVSGKRMCQVLERQGWTLARSRGSHRRYERGSDSVVVPYHTRDLAPGTQRQIMRAAGLTDEDVTR